MAMTMKADPSASRRSAPAIARCCLCFSLAEGARRILAHLKSNDPGQAAMRRDWIDEARSQTCVATSYALMARSMLQSSERRRRPERLS